MKAKKHLLLGISILGLGWGVSLHAQEKFASHASSHFDFNQQKEISPPTEPQSKEAAKQKYYKKYLAEYRYRTPQHRIFYQNGY